MNIKENIQNGQSIKNPWLKCKDFGVKYEVNFKVLRLKHQNEEYQFADEI